MKKFYLLALIVATVLGFANHGFAKIIDDFDDGNYSNPEWWTFDQITLDFHENDTKDQAHGKYSLDIKGDVQGWYSGGIGIYIANIADSSNVSNMIIDVYGYGDDSGQIKIEIIDDDNSNWQCEQDTNFQPVYDDRLSHQFKVNWSGWKTIKIPFASFKDDNPEIGDNKFNSDRHSGSGGLLQFNLILLGAQATGSAHIKIDNIKIE